MQIVYPPNVWVQKVAPQGRTSLFVPVRYEQTHRLIWGGSTLAKSHVRIFDTGSQSRMESLPLPNAREGFAGFNAHVVFNHVNTRHVDVLAVVTPVQIRIGIKLKRLLRDGQRLLAAVEFGEEVVNVINQVTKCERPRYLKRPLSLPYLAQAVFHMLKNSLSAEHNIATAVQPSANPKPKQKPSKTVISPPAVGLGGLSEPLGVPLRGNQGS